MKHRLMLSAVSILLALPATAEIYRCESDGVIAFSDRPCGSNQTLHADGKGISFITPDENLPALAEAAQAFIRERRERLARRDAERRPPLPPSKQSSNERVEKVYVPWPTRGHIKDGHSVKRNRRDETDARPRNPGDNGFSPLTGGDRYSPLNGPILGTRPNPAFDRRKRDPERDH